tara:strand:- start:974 stop:1159 length:186 start_codon:yes stop_codon:yes gene_type:complete
MFEQLLPLGCRIVFMQAKHFIDPWKVRSDMLVRRSGYKKNPMGSRQMVDETRGEKNVPKCA